MHSSTAWRQVVLIIWDQYHHSPAPVQGCVTVSDQQYQSFLPVSDQYQAVSPSETNATLLFHRLRLWDQYKAVSQSETSRVGRIVDIQMTGIIRCTGVVCINYQKWWGLCSILQTIIWSLVFLRCLFWSCILPKAVWMYQWLDKCTYCWTLFPSVCSLKHLSVRFLQRWEAPRPCCYTLFVMPQALRGVAGYVVIDTSKYLLVLGYSYHWNVQVLSSHISASLMFMQIVLKIELFY